jgi:long-subunit fatty acid transport protein
MIVSISYQHLFDFSREWDFTLNGTVDKIRYSNSWEYEQTGSLSAIGLSYCVQLIPERLSFGFTLNFWEDSISDNKWDQKYYSSSQIIRPSISYVDQYERIENYQFNGFNFNFGLLWDITDKWRIGAVIKTPFTADIDYKRTEYFHYALSTHDPSDPISNSDELKMPMSYGMGLLYSHSDRFSVSGDIYRTEWNNFEYKDKNGDRTNPLTGKPSDDSETKATCQIRIGGEYLLHKDEQRGFAIPLRGGLFYDPAPSERQPDDYYGFSLGSGFTLNGRFSIDIAYQYRFGNDVGEYIFSGMQFSQDIKEHMIYLSLIVYSF